MPHCVQSSLKVRYTSFRKIAFVGHVPTQAPQCMHSMSSIAMMPLSRTEGRIDTPCSGWAPTPLLDRHRELLLDFLAEVRPRVVRAERDDLAVGRREEVRGADRGVAWPPCLSRSYRSVLRSATTASWRSTTCCACTAEPASARARRTRSS